MALAPGRRQAIILINAEILVVNFKNKFQWNRKRNSYMFSQENAFENVVCEMAEILLRPQYVKWCERVTMSWCHHHRLTCWSEANNIHVYTNQYRWDTEYVCANEIEIKLAPCLCVDWIYIQITIIYFIRTKPIYPITGFLLTYVYCLTGHQYIMPWNLFVVRTYARYAHPILNMTWHIITDIW